MIDELIKKYEDTDKNEYIPPREILQDLKELKKQYILKLNKKDFAKECKISRPYLDKLLRNMSKGDVYEFCKLKNKIGE